MSRRRFVCDISVSPDLLRLADHSKFLVWENAAPYDAVLSTVQVDKLLVPTTAEEQQRSEHGIVVRVFGSAEQKEDES